jgi:hypothetical protein
MRHDRVGGSRWRALVGTACPWSSWRVASWQHPMPRTRRTKPPGNSPLDFPTKRSSAFSRALAASRRKTVSEVWFRVRRSKLLRYVTTVC